MKQQPCDINGHPVKIGTTIKLLSISEALLNILPDDEILEIKSMIGEKLKVYKIDEFGGVWVEKEFEYSENQVSSHSLKVESEEIKVVE